MAKKRKNQVKKQKTPLLSVLKSIARKLIYFFIALSIVFAVYLIDRSKLLDPNISWEIDGELITEAKRYDDVIEPLINNKYLLNLGHIKSKLKSSPWVAHVEAQRIFWNRIKVSIQEHDISMKWRSEGYISEGYISSKGILFKPNVSINSDAPIGIFSEINAKDSYFDFIKYQSILEPVKISIFKRTSIDELTLENNIKVILGHQKQNERLELFVKSFDKLKKFEKIKTRGIFDMRYPNGFALSYSPL